jgi:hypothetical protein
MKLTPVGDHSRVGLLAAQANRHIMATVSNPFLEEKA